jgi:type III restriction enzyme
MVKTRGIMLVQLSRQRIRLRDAAARKIDLHRKAAQQQAYQRLLFEQPPAELQTSPECVFAYDPSQYPANTTYPNPDDFPKHYYRAVGAMNGEETSCARLLESLPQVECWVRNLERQERFSFWLQMADHKFYPDFVVRLKDGRVLVVEYKGSHLETGEDTAEKRRIGELWEARSDGQCIFRLVTKEDYERQLRAV